MAVAGGSQSTLDLSLTETSLFSGRNCVGSFSGTHSRKSNVLVVAVGVAALEGHHDIGVLGAFGGEWGRRANVLDQVVAVLLSKGVLGFRAGVVFLCKCAGK